MGVRDVAGWRRWLTDATHPPPPSADTTPPGSPPRSPSR
jgi:hypothetical protein